MDCTYYWSFDHRTTYDKPLIKLNPKATTLNLDHHRVSSAIANKKSYKSNTSGERGSYLCSFRL